MTTTYGSTNEYGEEFVTYGGTPITAVSLTASVRTRSLDANTRTRTLEAQSQ